MATRRRHERVGAKLAAITGASLLAGLLAGPVGAVVPSTGGSVITANYGINVNTSVDAFDPHVSRDLATYTADFSIRYYNFVLGTHGQVPTPSGAVDSLSDLSDGRIVVTRDEGGDQKILIYEVGAADPGPIEIDPSPGSLRSVPAIGSATVAFIDLTVAATGNLHAAFVGGTGSTQVTNDGRITRQPSVAPSGNLIVYESCETDPADCSIRQAAWNGSSWQVTGVTQDGIESESNPDTDGAVIVYDADRAGERQIAWTPVGGGAEQVLEMSGTQRDPSVSGGIVSFMSEGSDGTADLYLYDIATNRVFQITSTAGIDELLNDVFRLASDRVRVVWNEGEAGDRDVRGADLTLPPVGPSYAFGGLLAPVDPLPTLNSMKAGAAVPVKFSLGGNFGLNIFAADYPKSQIVACDSMAPVDGVEQTVSAGGSGLAYDPASDLYTYVWKTDKAWAGTCRQLVLSFADGTTVARANFRFK